MRAHRAATPMRATRPSHPGGTCLFTVLETAAYVRYTMRSSSTSAGVTFGKWGCWARKPALREHRA
eukprot:13817368-Heterocapsa_arctica.AAC.1